MPEFPDAADHVFFLGYLDPGTGFVFSSAAVAFIKVLGAALVSACIFVGKKLRRNMRFSHVLIAISMIIIVISAAMNIRAHQSPSQSSDTRRVFILGFDGMDPQIVNEGIQQGMLPHFQKLKETGAMRRLETVTPPQSPVVWASFITGMNPAKHGMYDFIRRNPQSYALDLSTAYAKKRLIDKPTMWERLSDAQVPVSVLFLPDTYPPSPLRGVMISGMGVPDITGTEGKFTLFTSRNSDTVSRMQGTVIHIPGTDVVETSLPGPKYAFFTETKTAQIPMTIHRKKNTVTVTIQDKTITLGVHTFSGWVPVTFTVDFLTRIHGIVRFYVVSVTPDLIIYASPVNFDPMYPVYPISYPEAFAKQTAEKLGRFATLGLPLSTWALENNIYDERAFLTEVDDNLTERKKIYTDTLNNFSHGVLIAYFGTTDTVSHMFWRYQDMTDSPYRHTILNYYQKMDTIAGETMRAMKREDILIVLSDHGFGSFTYEMDVNAWLRENGYLVLKHNTKTGRELFADVDWSKTKAYAAGYNGVFVNQKGRERNGIVSPEDSPELLREIKTKLLSFTNPGTDSPVIKKVYERQQLSISETDEAAPDLSVGYYRGTRASWNSAVGGTGNTVISARKDKWSGDHLFDASEVPGVLITNKKITTKNPIGIIDILPTILSMYHIAIPEDIDGTPFQLQ